MRKYRLKIWTEKNKLLLLFILSLAVAIEVTAQINSPDSLKRVVANSKTDAGKIGALTQLADYYGHSNSDSEYHYATLLKETAIRTKNRSAEGYAIENIGESFMRRGNYVQNHVLMNEALKIFKEIKDSVNIANTYNGIGHEYKYQHNNKMALQYYRMTFELASQIKDFRDQVFGAMNLGTIYNRLDQPDSALYYSQIALDILDKHSVPYSRAYLLLGLAAIHLKIHQSSISQNLVYEALENATRFKDPTLYIVQTELASNLLFRNKFDSALYYATAAKKFVEENNNLPGRNSVYKALAQIFERKKQYDSAYFYQARTTTITDSLNSKDDANQLVNLTFNEQQREADLRNADIAFQNKLKLYAILGVLTLTIIILFFLFGRNKKQQKANKLLQKQKEQIQETIADLKSTQAQLIQSEKMASLGELTAGIAHEIQNPLNFVNNFSEVNRELLTEMKDEMSKGNIDDAKEIANDVIANEEKINHHGKRADAIVKGMLQHSRSSSGVKEPTDINKLADEYLRLAFHGLRAKDKSFNATLKTDFDESIKNINIIPQDIGRVILNLITNAFYVVDEKKKARQAELVEAGYEPTVSVSTKKRNNEVVITVSDNGTGIPDAIREKIFQPFFTTKPTGSGTGLGLSLAYDIIKAQGGELKAEKNATGGASFIIYLPVLN